MIWCFLCQLCLVKSFIVRSPFQKLYIFFLWIYSSFYDIDLSCDSMNFVVDIKNIWINRFHFSIQIISNFLNIISELFEALKLHHRVPLFLILLVGFLLKKVNIWLTCNRFFAHWRVKSFSRLNIFNRILYRIILWTCFVF